MQNQKTPLRIAIAAFVKTPELSPVKTRLARDLGSEGALAFYRMSYRSVESVLEASRNTNRVEYRWHPHWAVAEEAGLASWVGFPTIWQGEGGLGERLATIYHLLWQGHDAVFFVGADCPQIDLPTLETAAAELAESPFVMGPARDGGFYLFGSRVPVSKEIFQNVKYSADDTRDALIDGLAPLGETALIHPLTDVDHQGDLRTVLDEFSGVASQTPAQVTLVNWLKEHA